MNSYLMGLVLLSSIGFTLPAEPFILSDDVMKVVSELRKLHIIHHHNRTEQNVSDYDVYVHSNNNSQNFSPYGLYQLLGDINNGNDVKGKNCQCKSSSCGCCYLMSVPIILPDVNVCVNIALLIEEIGVQLIVTVGDKPIINLKLSAKDTPPICASVPFISELAKLCLNFYNLNFSNREFTGCASMDASLAFSKTNVNLGCYNVKSAAMGLYRSKMSMLTLSIIIAIIMIVYG